MTRKLGQLREKVSRYIASLAFLKRCRDHQLIPTGFVLKYHKKNLHTNKVLHRASLKILRNEIAAHRKILNTLNTELFKLHLDLATRLNYHDWMIVDRITANRSEYIQQKVTTTQQRKFSKITSRKTTSTLDTDKVVINLTNRLLDSPTKSALKKGFNFAIAPKKIPTEKIICGVEAAIVGMPVEIAEEIRQDVSTLVRNAKPPPSNISRKELQALSSLRKDSNIVVLPADKGNATVLMEKDHYHSKITELLEDNIYSKIRNPTSRIASEMKKLINHSSLEECDKKKLICQDPRSPVLYGLPKIHKEGIPLRPIVSAIGSITHAIARRIASELQPFVGNTPSYIKNSAHFIEKLSTLKLHKEDILVSFDVTSLFTNIPIEDTVSIIRTKLPQDLSNIAEFCLRSTYFMFNGQYYKQNEGSPMGSPLSPVAANLFMESFEERVLTSTELRPECWWRYVDDVFLIWRHGPEELQNFLKHTNSIHKNIRFTMELEENGRIPFLDVLETKKPETLKHSVYRKPTHTDRYLHGDSHQHPEQKAAVI